ncbi:hypothetical protein OUZ56_028138 [Daphnia magna]|uniref:Ig-like domain-containing protein n=1 Tax=Daphnia magna TaxID=35525 RepID=A0ABR0B2Y6_9CRUS|nr:hypothetical protein OUZ56_028138 [Daphnia magna]
MAQTRIENLMKFYFTIAIVPLIYSEVIIGNMAELTCDLTSSVPGDYVLLVLWYKDGETMPFYR